MKKIIAGWIEELGNNIPYEWLDYKPSHWRDIWGRRSTSAIKKSVYGNYWKSNNILICKSTALQSH